MIKYKSEVEVAHLIGGDKKNPLFFPKSEWISKAIQDKIIQYSYDPTYSFTAVITPRGRFVLKEGDCVLRDEDGVIHACEQSFFETVYREIE